MTKQEFERYDRACLAVPNITPLYEETEYSENEISTCFVQRTGEMYDIYINIESPEAIKLSLLFDKDEYIEALFEDRILIDKKNPDLQIECWKELKEEADDLEATMNLLREIFLETYEELQTEKKQERME